MSKRKVEDPEDLRPAFNEDGMQGIIGLISSSSDDHETKKSRSDDARRPSFVLRSNPRQHQEIW
jgi:hypothetical protein